MNTQLVSIIIPFYNEEDYIARAIESAIYQTYNHIEIILVNDGSTDNSLTIANNYKKKQENITLITTSNCGLGSARNTGIKNANGNYITFLDADDVLVKNMVASLVKNSLQYKSDISICKFNLFNSNQDLISIAGFKSIHHQIDTINGASGMYKGYIASTVWAKLYKREIINELFFLPSIWFEDRPFLLEYLLKAKRISFQDEVLLHIHARKDSISRKIISERRIIDHHNVFLTEMELIKKYQKKNELLGTIIEHHLNVILDNYLIISIDKKFSASNNLKKCKNTHLKYTKLFREYLKKLDYKLKFKKQILVFLLRSPKYLPWGLVAFFFTAILCTSRYKMISKLKE